MRERGEIQASVDKINSDSSFRQVSSIPMGRIRVSSCGRGGCIASIARVRSRGWWHLDNGAPLNKKAFDTTSYRWPPAALQSNIADGMMTKYSTGEDAARARKTPLSSAPTY